MMSTLVELFKRKLAVQVFVDKSRGCRVWNNNSLLGHGESHIVNMLISSPFLMQ